MCRHRKENVRADDNRQREHTPTADVQRERNNQQYDVRNHFDFFFKVFFIGAIALTGGGGGLPLPALYNLLMVFPFVVVKKFKLKRQSTAN